MSDLIEKLKKLYILNPLTGSDHGWNAAIDHVMILVEDQPSRMAPTKYLRKLPDYHFDRNEFVKAFKIVFSIDEIYELEVACQEHRCLDGFHLYYADDEFYIIHLESGTIINWYKHLGRTNTCNKEGFSLLDLIELLKMLKESISGKEKGNEE